MRFHGSSALSPSTRRLLFAAFQEVGMFRCCELSPQGHKVLRSLESRAWSSGIREVTIDEIRTRNLPHVEPNKAVERLERFELLSRAAAHFQISGIPETWKFGSIG
jgi:hypothetical protein